MNDDAFFRICLTQWQPDVSIDRNVAIACELVRKSAEAGAELVLLPENSLVLGTNTSMRAAALSLSSPEIGAIGDAAARAGVAVMIGGFKEKSDDGSVRNSAVLFDRNGALRAVYNKIHLFDANIGEQSFEASSVEMAGSEPVIVELGDAVLGVTICYDIRFPQLYRRLAMSGANVFLVPSAFTKTTGAAHWETLLRARAIENGCFVVASATVGSVRGGTSFETYGHAMVVDPWGRVLTDLDTASPAFQVVPLELGLVEKARSQLPTLKQGRPDVYASEISFVKL